MDAVLRYEAGSVILFTEGEYSDFGHCGMIVTLKPLDLPKAAQEFTTGKDRYDVDKSAFVGWLVSQGYAMPVDLNTFHLGEYGDWSDELNVKFGED